LHRSAVAFRALLAVRLLNNYVGVLAYLCSRVGGIVLREAHEHQVVLPRRESIDTRFGGMLEDHVLTYFVAVTIRSPQGLHVGVRLVAKPTPVILN